MLLAAPILLVCAFLRATTAATRSGDTPVFHQERNFDMAQYDGEVYFSCHGSLLPLRAAFLRQPDFAGTMLAGLVRSEIPSRFIDGAPVYEVHNFSPDVVKAALNYYQYRVLPAKYEELFKEAWHELLLPPPPNIYFSFGHAVLRGLEDVVRQFILQHGNIVNKAFDNGWLPLHCAALKNQVAVASMLLQAGADPGAAIMTNGVYNGTALHVACLLGHTDMVQELVDDMVNVDQLNADGQTALHLCAWHGHLAATRYLLRSSPSANVDATDKHGRTPLLCAAMNGHMAVVTVLLDSGANVNFWHRWYYGTYSSMTALDYAISNCDSEMYTVLRERGARLPQIGDDTPYHKAAREGRADVIRFLHDVVKFDVSIDARISNNLNTPLYMAAESGHFDAIATLIALGATVDMPDKVGQTPLHMASHKGSVESVDVLLKSGASLEVMDSCNRAALHRAAYKTNTLILERIITADPALFEKYYDSAYRNAEPENKEYLKAWLQHIQGR